MSHFSQAMLTLLSALLACLVWTAAGFASGDIRPVTQLNVFFMVCDLALTAASFLLLAIFCFAPIKRSLAVVLVLASALLFLSSWHDLLRNLLFTMPPPMESAIKVLRPAGLILLALGAYRIIKAYRLSRLLLGSYRKIEHSLSTRDQTTQLFNRRYFYSSCSELLSTCQANGETCALITFAITDLPDINTRYSMQHGDAVLSELGRVLLNNTREQDIACRIGGRKLALFLPNMQTSDAEPIAKRLQSLMATVTLSHPEQTQLSVRIQWDIQQSSETTSLEDLVNDNEAALSRAA